MVEKVYPMTLEDKEKLGKELEELKTVKRGEIIEQVKIAHGFGNLSENSEHESAKDEQAFAKGGITTTKDMVRFTQIIDSDSIDAGEVSIGKTIMFIGSPDGGEEEYTIVGGAETDPFFGRISDDSPIAQVLIGKCKNDEVTITTPGGDMLVRIVEVEQAQSD